MQLCEKLQKLRKQEGITQEALAEKLYVSRTAISKWEAGRGYPNIDSLKAIAGYFNITVDELLSSKELISVAESTTAEKTGHIKNTVFGLLDLSALLLLLAPIFGRHNGSTIIQVPLLLADNMQYIKVSFCIIIILRVLFGAALLALQNCDNEFWLKKKETISLCMSIICVFMFILTLEPYAAVYSFMLIVIKGTLLLKRL